MPEHEKRGPKSKPKAKVSDQELDEKLKQQWTEFEAVVSEIVEQRLTPEELEKEANRWLGCKGKSPPKKRQEFRAQVAPVLDIAPAYKRRIWVWPSLQDPSMTR